MATVALLLPLLLLLLQAGASAATVTALNYSVTLAPFLYSPSASQHFLSGSVSARVSVLNDTRWLLLRRGSNLQLGDIWLQDGRRNVSVNSTEFVNATQEEVVTLNEVLQAGRQYVLVVPLFSAEVKWLQYPETWNETRFAAASIGLSVDQFLPFISDLTAKVKVDVSIVRRSDFSAVTNSESVGNRTEENVASWWPEVDANETDGFSWIRETFATTEAMPLSSLQFVVSQLQLVDSRTDSKGRQHRFWSSGFGDTCLACLLSKEILFIHERLEQQFGVEYPASKVDYVVFIAKKGLVTRYNFSLGIGSLELNYRNFRSPGRTPGEWLLYSLAQQQSSVWLGQISRGRWLSGLSWVQAFALLTRAHPEWLVNSTVFMDIRGWWQMKAVKHVVPRGENATKLSELMSWLGFRPAAVLLQLRNVIGADAYDSSLRAMVQQFAASADWPTDQQLLANLTAASRIAERMLLDYSSSDQLPVVNCSVSGNQLVLRQQSMYHDDSNTTWTIPITMVTSENNTMRRWNGTEQWDSVQWLTQRQQSFASFNDTRQPSSWYLLNLRGVGLYRVNYNTENWAALARQLRQNHRLLHPSERAALLEDGFELMRLGMLNVSVMADIFGYIINETHPLPLSKIDPALKMITMFHRRMVPLAEAACRLLSQMKDGERETLAPGNFNLGDLGNATIPMLPPGVLGNFTLPMLPPGIPIEPPGTSPAAEESSGPVHPISLSLRVTDPSPESSDWKEDALSNKDYFAIELHFICR